MPLPSTALLPLYPFGWPISTAAVHIHCEAFAVCPQTKFADMDANEVLEASLFCQLPANALTKHEDAIFGQNVHAYFPARDLCLELWRKNPGQFLAFSQCVEEAQGRGVSMRDLLQAYRFLNSNGYINAGVPDMDESMPHDDRLILTTVSVLRDSNLDVRSGSQNHRGQS